MDIEFVRSRFIKHFDGKVTYMLLLDESTSLVSIPITMAVSYSLVLSIKVSWPKCVPMVLKTP